MLRVHGLEHVSLGGGKWQAEIDPSARSFRILGGKDGYKGIGQVLEGEEIDDTLSAGTVPGSGFAIRA